eukprot:362107-Chlamydomonas_euryale.AAC.9
MLSEVTHTFVPPPSPALLPPWPAGPGRDAPPSAVTTVAAASSSSAAAGSRGKPATTWSPRCASRAASASMRTHMHVRGRGRGTAVPPPFAVRTGCSSPTETRAANGCGGGCGQKRSACSAATVPPTPDAPRCAAAVRQAAADADELALASAGAKSTCAFVPWNANALTPHSAAVAAHAPPSAALPPLPPRLLLRPHAQGPGARGRCASSGRPCSLPPSAASAPPPPPPPSCSRAISRGACRWGFGVPKCVSGADSAPRSAAAARQTEAMPAAGSACPICDLSADSDSGNERPPCVQPRPATLATAAPVLGPAPPPPAASIPDLPPPAK